jgi:hypothetical protein
MKANQLLLAAILASSIVAPIETLAEDKRMMVHPMTPAVGQLPIEGEFPSLSGATGWLNSPPLTAAGLRGKVVVVDFWTYTCINWLRTERLGREVQGSGSGDDWRAHARIRL